MSGPGDIFKVDQVGAIGYVGPQDMRPHELPPNAWHNASNVKTRNGGMELHGGFAPIDPVDRRKYHEAQYMNNEAGLWWVLLGDDGVTQTQLSGTDVTHAHPITYPDEVWHVDRFNGNLVMTNNNEPPIHIPSDAFFGQAPALLDGWPSGDKAKFIISYKAFLIAGNIEDNTRGHLPTVVRWSDSADVGAMPPNWDISGTAGSLAGEASLATDNGALIAGKTLRDIVMLYCEHGAFVMQFTGDSFVFELREQFSNMGIFGPRCVEEFDGTHFLITQDDFVVHDGNQPRSVADQRVRETFFSMVDVSAANKVLVRAKREAKEIWVLFPSSPGFDEPDLALVWDWAENTWTYRDLPVQTLPEAQKSGCRFVRELPMLSVEQADKNFGYSYQSICERFQPSATPCTDPDITGDTPGAGQDSYSGVGEQHYGSVIGTLGDIRFVAGGAHQDNELLFYLNNSTVKQYHDDTEEPVVATLNRRNLNLNGDQMTAIVNRIWPRIEGTGEVEVWIGSQDWLDQAPHWEGPFLFDPEKGYKVDVRCRGRFHAFRIKSYANPMRATGYDLDYRSIGMR